MTERTAAAVQSQEPEGGQPTGQAISRAAIVRSLLRDWMTLFAITFLTLLAIAAAGADFIAPFDPLDDNLRLRNMPPMTPAAEGGFPHVLGTDPLGRDMLSRLIFGARISMLVGFSAALISGAMGTTLGVLAGYYRGRLDDIIMRLVDLQMGIPFLLLALFALFILGPSLLNVILILAVVNWMIFARVARGMTLDHRETTFVDAARATGCSDMRIIVRHLLPNLASPLLILVTLEVAGLILAEASLSFLGFGIQPPTPSWGLMVSGGRRYVSSAWWLVTLPGLAIFLTALSLNLLASSLRAVTDPVQRERWLSFEPGRARERGR